MSTENRTMHYDDLYGGLPPHQKNRWTSRLAAIEIAPKALTMRARVLSYLDAMGDHGAIDDEGEQDLDMSHTSYSPRRRELAIKGMVVDSGRTRLTRSGKKAVVWVVAKGQRSLDL